MERSDGPGVSHELEGEVSRGGAASSRLLSMWRFAHVSTHLMQPVAAVNYVREVITTRASRGVRP